MLLEYNVVSQLIMHYIKHETTLTTHNVNYIQAQYKNLMLMKRPQKPRQRVLPEKRPLNLLFRGLLIIFRIHIWFSMWFYNCVPPYGSIPKQCKSSNVSWYSSCSELDITTFWKNIKRKNSLPVIGATTTTW